jgi:hypothetical protein
MLDVTHTNRDQVADALSRFHSDDRGLYISSAFFDLDDTFREKNLGGKAISAISGITHDIWNMAALAERAEWTRNLALEGSISHGRWRTFSSLDIEHFLVQARSIMDHVAEILKYATAKREQTPGSFHALRHHLVKHEHRLPPGVGKLIASASWFDQLRDVRDSLVHMGAKSTVFGEAHEGILFQVYGTNALRYVEERDCMHSESVVKFDLYAAMLTGNILYFLEQLGLLLESKERLRLRIGQARVYSPGFQVLKQWMDRFLAQNTVLPSQ